MVDDQTKNRGMMVFEVFIAHLKQYTDLDAIKKQYKDSSGIIDELYSYTLICSRKIIDPDPDNYIQYDPDEATIVGLLVKQHKSLEQLIHAHDSGFLDVAWPFIRINYEAYIKMLYLIRGGKDAQRDYRLKSYKNRYRMYEKYNKKGNGVTDVFLYKFLEDIKSDGFTIQDFEAVASWKAFEGKSFEKLMIEFEPEDLYLSSYALSSDSIHSDWGDIRQLHLQERDGCYAVKIEPKKYHGRVILACVYLHLQALESFLEWYKTDFGAEILQAEDLITELKRVSKILLSYFLKVYESKPDVFVKN